MDKNYEWLALSHQRKTKPSNRAQWGGAVSEAVIKFF